VWQKHAIVWQIVGMKVIESVAETCHCMANSGHAVSTV